MLSISVGKRYLGYFAYANTPVFAKVVVLDAYETSNFLTWLVCSGMGTWARAASC